MDFVIYHFPCKWLIVCMTGIHCVQMEWEQFTAAVSKILVAQNSHSHPLKGFLGLLININVSRMTSQGAEDAGI